MARKKTAKKTKTRGADKGDLIPPPALDPDAEERKDALPQQEDFWKPPVRFGSVPVESEPLGWDRRRGFRKLFPAVYLPFQVVDRVSFGHRELEPNRLFWGDNLHVMRQLPSESIDLIYIDPPFFSGRNYNVIFGDQNELRSFTDIWEGGMPGYLIWLNARLYEMKRLLKKTGSLIVHCDWHASHYIKCELDKILGYDNFRNEIVWYYKRWTAASRNFQRMHDVLLWYSKTDNYKFNKQLQPHADSTLQVHGKRKRVNAFLPDGSMQTTYVEEETKGVSMHDVWEVKFIVAHSHERIGYPTQKPIELLQRVIDAASDPGDLVADFFCGGGSFALAAMGARVVRDPGLTSPTYTLRQELQRRWVACDQSRVALAITADRLARAGEQLMLDKVTVPIPDFTVEHWGVYEASRLAEMPPDQFRAFVLRCFGATPEPPSPQPSPGGRGGNGNGIHGMKGAVPVWVGDSNPRQGVTAQDVQHFANAIRKTLRYKQDNLRDGIMLGWAFRKDAVEAAERLRKLEQTDLNFIRLDQVRIDSPRFREHVAALTTKHADYETFLTFVQPPRVEVGYKRLKPRTYLFDVSETVVLNAGAKIINVQWDFDYGRRFSSTPGYSFVRGKKGDPTLQVEYEFAAPGSYSVACKVQDDMGGEGMWSGEVGVK